MRECPVCGYEMVEGFSVQSALERRTAWKCSDCMYSDVEIVRRTDVLVRDDEWQRTRVRLAYSCLPVWLPFYVVGNVCQAIVDGVEAVHGLICRVLDRLADRIEKARRGLA